MWRDQKLAVIVPAHQEERIIERMLRKVPAYVDHIYVVDDASTDATASRVQSAGDARVTLLRHAYNRGVGAAIATGYARALRDGCDLLAVMAGDDQMDPSDLPRLLEALDRGGSDYVKGNRLLHAEWQHMPLARRLGSRALSLVTRAATGLRVGDCQCGYTLLRASSARRLPLEQLWPRYGYPNDLLGMLAAAGARVSEVPVRPVYADEASGLRPYHAGVVAYVIARRWWLGSAAAPSDLRRLVKQRIRPGRSRYWSSRAP